MKKEKNSMAIDEVPKQDTHIDASGNSGSNAKSWILFAVLAALVIAHIYTFAYISSLRTSLENKQTQVRQELLSQMQANLSSMEQSNAQQLTALKDELDTASEHLGAQRTELKRARAMVTKLQTDQQQQASELKTEIARKADQEQLGALNQDVTAQRTDLESTKKTVGDLSNNLGMTRSQFGTLIARNHDDVEYLRKLGERDYFEFTVDKRQPRKVAGIGLTLKKTNVKWHRFTLAMLVDDLNVEKKDRTINEPIFFYVNGSKKPYELVVNSVQSNQVKGYVSTPKGVTQVAQSEGTR
jgi:hypothetical protein